MIVEQTIQALIVAALGEDGSLTALLGGPGRVRKDPDAISRPCIRVAEPTPTAPSLDQFLTETEHEFLTVIHVWTDNKTAANDLCGYVIQAIDDAPLIMDEYEITGNRQSIADVRREADGRTWHGIIKFHCIVRCKIKVRA